MLSTDKQTDKLTNTTKNITSFAKEVINVKVLHSLVPNENLCFSPATTAYT